MKIAPVVLFVYNRPDHLVRVLAHLKLNEGASETLLYIFSEGPKPDASDEEKKRIDQVREIIHQVNGFKTVIISEAEKNIGCALSMTTGISKVLYKHERAIILEDDILTHPQFLSFCNTGLDLYEHEEKIKQIGGFMFPCRSKLPTSFLSDAVFCWGWATWKRAWNDMSMDAEKFMRQIKNNRQENKFDLEGAYPYMTSLQQQVSGKIDAWDICWYATIFLQHGLSVYPGNSLTQNIGMDGSGTHFTGAVQHPITSFQVPDDLLLNFPKKMEPDENVQRELYKAVRDWGHVPFLRRGFNKISSLLLRMRSEAKS